MLALWLGLDGSGEFWQISLNFSMLSPLRTELVHYNVVFMLHVIWKQFKNSSLVVRTGFPQNQIFFLYSSDFTSVLSPKLWEVGTPFQAPELPATSSPS